MRTAPFEFVRPATVGEAVAAIAAGATPLAGGQSLIAAMRLRDAEPGMLCDLRGVADLDADIALEDAQVRIGALATHRALLEHPVLGEEMPWLVEAARRLGDVQVRNQGTVLGNVCWADPRANFAVALLASGASVVARDANGESRIPLDAFFTGFRRHALGARLAVALEVPRPGKGRGCYLELSRQRQDLALVNVCAVRAAGALRVAVGGIDPVPVRLAAVEAHGASALGDALAADLHEPVVDPYGDARYKLHVAGVLVRRALQAIGEAA